MNYPVKIVVLNSAGDMAYSVSVLHVARGDSITWSCETGPITISFRDPSPLDEGRQIRSLPGPVHTAVGTVSLRATSGVHYYAVAASMDGKVFLDPGCPEIIVDNNGPRWMASEPEAETEEAEVEEDTAKEPEFLQLLEPDEELEKVSAGAPIYKVELEEEPEELFAAAPSSKPVPSRVTRYTRVLCPRRVWIRVKSFPLDVSLSVNRGVGTRPASVDPSAPVVVHVTGSSGLEVLGVPSAELRVLPEADSEPHRFLLHPIKSGWQTIRVEYSQAGHPVAEVPVSIEVTNYDVPIVQQPVSAPLLTPGNAEPPELQLYITYFDPVLSFSLQRKGKARIDFPPLRIGSLEAFMEPRYRALDMLRETRTDSLALEVRSKPRKLSEKGANDRIQRLGRVIWQDLIPAELRAIYSRERESWKGRSLVIYSNETFVPWELLLPFDEMGGTWKDEEPWCTTMALTRWLRPPPAPRSAIDAPLTQPVAGSPPSELSLTNMGVVVPKQPQSAKLKAAKGEDAFLQRFRKQHRVRYAGVKPANSERVLTMLRDGKYDWLHAATHGNSLSGQFKDAPLWLEDDESITPDDMVDGDIIHALNERKPAFVLNACELGRGGWTLRATSAWAERLVPKGASLFIAPLWTVTDSLAMKFVTTLYERLAANETLAEAVRKARHAARKGADPTWLAYSVYGHPNAKLQVGSKATPDA